jgi:predicted nuclease of restriction endonuclease-like (RecB) superfamily
MNYYEEIKDKLLDVEIQNKVKDYSKNKYTLEKYYEIGKLLIEAQGGEKRAKYGDGLIKEYSRKLVKELGKKYNIRYLMDIRKLYIFSKVHSVSAQLTFSHYRKLFVLNDDNEINYYIEKCTKNNISTRHLDSLIKSKEYERLPDSTKNKMISKEEINITDIVPNPIIINNPNNVDVIKEKVLQQLILEDIPSFLKQLGNGFTFIDNEYPVLINGIYNYIDLLLFNIDFNCYVVIELKLNKLNKDNIGQILCYMNCIDNNLKKINHNKTVGIILTKKDNHFIAEYCSNYNILSREYKIC